MKKVYKHLISFTVLTLLFLVAYFALGGLGTAHAQDLHTDLVNGQSSQTWIFTIWKVALALANVIVIVMLLFVAVVNIVHLQYDTYAIKKSLPLLIIGIIMSNFSLLICRMIVDAAQVLSNTFAANPRDLAEGLLCSMGFATTQSSITVALLTASGLSGIAIILMIILMFVILIAVVILAFLLWLRKFVIFLLVAVAPVAFILYAFPPTQGLFKQWWGWFLKWTFMGPVIMLLVWVASEIGATNCTAINGNGTFSISALFATVGVIYLAAIVPFKLGGPLMGAWGKAGQWLTGSGKGGFARKPVDDYLGRKKDNIKGTANAAWSKTLFGKKMDEGLARDTFIKANQEEALAIRQGAAQDRFMKRSGKISNKQEQVERSIGSKRVKEQVADLDLSSREGLSEAFERMEKNGDTLGMKALVEFTATNAMISDVMSEASQKMKTQYGDGLLDTNGNFKTDLESQQMFVKRVLSSHNNGTDDLRTRNRIQEAWVKSGIYSAKNIIKDENASSGYRELDMSNTADRAKYVAMTRGRAQSPHAQKMLQTLRKETFFDNDGQLTDNAIDLLQKGLLTEEHIKLLGRSRASVLQQFNNAGNIERLEAAGLNNISQKIQELGYGKRLGPDKIIVKTIDPTTHQLSNRISEIAISDIQAQHFQDESVKNNIENNIINRISSEYQPGQLGDPIARLNQEVQNNINFAPDFKARVQAISALRAGASQVSQLGQNSDQDKQLISDISKSISQHLGSAIQHNVDTIGITNDILSRVKEPIRTQLRDQIKNQIKTSESTIISPENINITAKDIIGAYETAKKSGPKLTENEIRLKFMSELGKESDKINADEASKAWRIIELYNNNLTGAVKKQKSAQTFGDMLDLSILEDEEEE